MSTPERFPLGVSDFRTLVTDNYQYVDKTLSIKQVHDDGATTIILTRPRRFGKTLFMSMLQHFYASNVNGYATRAFFSQSALKAQQPAFFERHQGQYSVISISLKDVKQETFESTIRTFKNLVASLFQKHDALLKSKKLTSLDKERFMQLYTRESNLEDLQNALLYLSDFLNKAYGRPIIILIDEYDTPIIHSYLKGYYAPLIEFMRGFFSSALKDNVSCYKAVISGILRVAKESLFSDLNNAAIYTLLSKKYYDAFGFTLNETKNLIENTQRNYDLNSIQNWYNGYLIGDEPVFNPWSIIQCLSFDGELAPYWVNTSSNELIIDTLAKSTSNFKVNLQNLMQSKEVLLPIDFHVHFKNLADNDDALWSLLYFSGYLTGTTAKAKGLTQMIHAKIPNQEIMLLYQNILTKWFSNVIGNSQFEYMLSELTCGNVEFFTAVLKKLLMNAMSYFDASGHEPERFYHGLVLGLVAALQDKYMLLSNRESGLGRYDLALLPLDKARLGIVFEFKTEALEERLAKTAALALKQIDDNQYITTLKQAGLGKVLKIGMAFCSKKFAVRTSMVSFAPQALA